MQRSLFIGITEALGERYPYFQQKKDATGYSGFHPFIKGTAAMRMLAYGGPGDAVDEYLKMGASTAREALIQFCAGVIECYGEQYLRSPNENDLDHLLATSTKRGLPGMLGSIDCMHWEWKNCPTGWEGQYQGKESATTIILEAVASHDLFIWHSFFFFGVPGTCNDINVLHKSPLFNNIIHDIAPKVKYTINSHEYNMGYYLADGIYPDWATFVKPFPVPQGKKQQVHS